MAAPLSGYPFANACRVDFGGLIRYKDKMNIYPSGIIVFSLLFSAAAKPGEPYVLTGREKSILSIYQADMKAYRELYEDEDINEYYKEFKTLNNLLDGRKLNQGEELMFPHTKKSKEIEEAEEAKAARAAKSAETAAARKQARGAPAANYDKQGEQLSLFGSDSPSRPRATHPEDERKRAEALRKDARQKSVYYFQHTFLPDWIYSHSNEILEKGNVDVLVTNAREKVDEDFAESLILHRYPDKSIYILEFEKPENVNEYFFVAIKMRESGGSYFYTLEKGISFFGAGEVSVLFEWRSRRNVSKLGGRNYKDLSSFLQELEKGRPVNSGDK